ncbi:aldose epimerase family protein [Arenibacter latericius]|uniref:aldose epimerase family protein n=1 Tax=Arenibacter latericius TaxID=86104 RepID=UPI000422EAD3|nr:aldose epimerase family protein [Arenibacter latericius]MDX1365328.1 aldose epimerase family protein [Arenibacter latericius]
MKLATIQNNYITLTVLEYGAIIQKLVLKDKHGKDTNVVVGFEEPEKYLTDNKSLGACIGRYAGRISNSSFTIDGISYPLYSENGVHLHGGKEGFGKKTWNIKEVHEGENPHITLTYFSKDMEEGYPGNLSVTLTYKLIGASLHIIHEATTDKSTPINLTNHSYFNLDGEEQLNHYDLQMPCSDFIALDHKLMPTGEVVSVKGSDYDFLHQRKIGETQLDTPFVLDTNLPYNTKLATNKSGITMEVITNQHSMVVYTPPEFAAICFETQNYPDAPNQPNFPNSILNPGESYHNETEYRFGFVT